MILPSDTLPPITDEVGYINANSESVAKIVRAVSNSLQDKWQVTPQSRLGESLYSVASTLRPSVPKTCIYVLPIGKSWSVLMSNGPAGTDVTSEVAVSARQHGHLGVRAVASTRRPHVATILEVFDDSGQMHRRTIAAANDGGRWVFETSGEPFEFEDMKMYAARQKRDRFTPDMLERYLLALGVPCTTEPNYRNTIAIVNTLDAPKPAPNYPVWPPES